jgi:O-antigen ligase
MNADEFRYGEKTIPVYTSIASASGFVEYGFYFYMVYTLLGGVFGLWVSNLASGLLILLVILCLSEVGSQAIPVIGLLAYPLGCGVAFTLIQLFFFSQSLTVDTVRPFLIWMLVLFLVQLLALRPNFLHRFALAMSLIGLAALPYLSFYQAATTAGAMQRAGLNRAIGFGSTNAMGEWYGFCALYFMLLGWKARTNTVRNLSWLIAVGCLYVVTLTVSRGALLAVAIAIVMAARHFLKNGFLPILMAACVGWIIIELGVFEETARLYAARGAEETGRLVVWPLIIESFLDSPWIGVGHANVGATPPGGHLITPHNGFLYIAQSSGIVPLGFFIAYWVRAARAVFNPVARKSADAIFYLPFLAFTFLTVNVGNLTFMELSAIASLAFPMAASFPRSDLDLRDQVSDGGFERAG